MKILETRWAFCLLTTALILPLNALAAASADDGNVVNAVSYTHLTLPTICSV